MFLNTTSILQNSSDVSLMNIHIKKSPLEKLVATLVEMFIISSKATQYAGGHLGKQDFPDMKNTWSYFTGSQTIGLSRSVLSPLTSTDFLGSQAKIFHFISCQWRCQGQNLGHS